MVPWDQWKQQTSKPSDEEKRKKISTTNNRNEKSERGSHKTCTQKGKLWATFVCKSINLNEMDRFLKIHKLL